MLFLLALNWNLLEKAFSSVKTKIYSSFPVKLAERSNHSLLLSVSWTTPFKHLHSLVGVTECIEINWLCKHTEKVRSSQAAILVLNWVNFSELYNKPTARKFLQNFQKLSEHLFFRTAVSRCFLLMFMKLSGYLKYYDFNIAIKGCSSDISK